jgi:hypothetical protein
MQGGVILCPFQESEQAVYLLVLEPYLPVLDIQLLRKCCDPGVVLDVRRGRALRPGSHSRGGMVAGVEGCGRPSENFGNFFRSAETKVNRFIPYSQILHQSFSAATKTFIISTNFYIKTKKIFMYTQIIYAYTNYYFR